jgi:hypothetical protein
MHTLGHPTQQITVPHLEFYMGNGTQKVLCSWLSAETAHPL